MNYLITIHRWLIPGMMEQLFRQGNPSFEVLIKKPFLITCLDQLIRYFANRASTKQFFSSAYLQNQVSLL